MVDPLNFRAVGLAQCAQDLARLRDGTGDQLAYCFARAVLGQRGAAVLDEAFLVEHCGRLLVAFDGGESSMVSLPAVSRAWFRLFPAVKRSREL